jgi:hypothetical protein
MIFFTPDIGTLLKLEQDWIFTLYSEYRNVQLFSKLKDLGNGIEFSTIFGNKDTFDEFQKIYRYRTRCN